ncbi:hypothetical protein DFA_08395 [Cavenderia fasciculata]|uniref:Crinkler (CRN) family protein n=1 Tax=Cavenderia fasciculata TaxID=261658 RepID=F4Q5Z1_CACFS|nr:uncharacterized protein DFA_08395 [Cavenderia fasciculata]EGG17400.1 hypothetical protein DFA_08395 [Cavenderia fasciculata]|eukprot:XP_004355884.1 hypothetical protein DFA_08395 [Cavenderia fasciculata]
MSHPKQTFQNTGKFSFFSCDVNNSNLFFILLYSAPKYWTIVQTSDWFEDFKKKRPAANDSKYKEGFTKILCEGSQLVLMSKESFMSKLEDFGIDLYDILTLLKKESSNTAPAILMYPTGMSPSLEQPTRYLEALPHTFIREANTDHSSRRGEGIHLGDYSVVDRNQKLDILMSDLKKHKVMVIRCPPESGKTSFCQLLEHRAQQTYEKMVVRRVSMSWTGPKSLNGMTEFDSFWTYFTGETLNGLIVASREQPVLIIIDECQLSYDNSHFQYPIWTMLKFILNNMPHFLHILFVGAYGYDRVQGAGTPIRDLESLGIEFLNFDAKESLHSTRTCYISSSNFYRDFQSMTRSYTDLGSLDATDMEFIQVLVVNMVNENSANFDVEMSTPKDRASLIKAVKNVILVVRDDRIDIFKEDGTDRDKYEVQFSSPVCKTYYIMQCLESPKELRTIDGFLNESAWYMEFYYSASSFMSCFVLPSYGKGKIAGCVDLFVNGKYQWAIEFTSEGENVKRHRDRFLAPEKNPKYKDQGAYYNVGLDWVVVDFRHPKKSLQVSSMHDHVWYIFYSDDYQTYTVLHKESTCSKYC